jgi:hypothetical protein
MTWTAASPDADSGEFSGPVDGMRTGAWDRARTGRVVVPRTTCYRGLCDGAKSTVGGSVPDGGDKIVCMPNTPEVSLPPSAGATNLFGARAMPAAVALALVAVPGALTLMLVKGKWAPLLRADNGARDRLHDFAVTHTVFVNVMQLISDSGSALAWLSMRPLSCSGCSGVDCPN